MTTESWTITDTQHVDISEIASLVVGLNAGELEIVGDPTRTYGAAIDVTEVSERPLQVTRHDGEVRISYDYSGVEGLLGRVRGIKDKDRAVVRVVVPTTIPVRVTTARADVTVVGVSGDVSVTTASGAVRAQGVTGPIGVQTASGGVELVEHVGDASINTGSGAVVATGALGRVTARTVAGNVQLEAPSSTPLVSVQTISGDVCVLLGAGVPVNLRAKSVNGKVSLDGEELTSSASHTTSVSHVDEHGRAGAYVSTSTISGDVAVTRGDDATATRDEDAE